MMETDGNTKSFQVTFATACPNDNIRLLNQIAHSVQQPNLSFMCCADAGSEAGQ